jgi:hypothetical protein
MSNANTPKLESKTDGVEIAPLPISYRKFQLMLDREIVLPNIVAFEWMEEAVLVAVASDNRRFRLILTPAAIAQLKMGIDILSKQTAIVDITHV